jgi:sigma-B regulation protein RsbU (phosphoserine phosphatase)
MDNSETVINDLIREKLKQHEILSSEANTIREKDKILIKSLFQNFYSKNLNVGIGFQRAYGSILSGDYFDLIKLPDGNYLFVFADMSGHGVPAYTNLVRLRSAITISISESKKTYEQTRGLDTDILVREIYTKFTDIMDDANSHDFACVIFTFIYSYDDKFYLKFYNRSMLFPIVIRKFNSKVVEVYNLNRRDKGWFPVKGNLLSSDIRNLLEDKYLDTPSCEFMLYEGDSILYFSDGVVEAINHEVPAQEFGEDRLIQILVENQNLMPQLIVHELLNAVYNFIGNPEYQKDDMTVVLIDFPPLRY